MSAFYQPTGSKFVSIKKSNTCNVCFQTLKIIENILIEIEFYILTLKYTSQSIDNIFQNAFIFLKITKWPPNLNSQACEDLK